MRPRITTTAALALVALAACGGGDDGEGGGVFDGIGDAAESFSADQPDDAGAAGSDASPAGGSVGEVTHTADELAAWVEIDGERLDIPVSGTISFECLIADDNVQINFQTPEDFLTIRGAVFEGNWSMSLNFDPSGDTNVMYGGQLEVDGTVGLSDTALSFEGTLDEVVDFDLTNVREVPATVAVNCANSGPEPSATIAGVEYEVPFVGARGIRCEVSADEIDIDVSQQVPERRSIAISASNDGSSWLGNAAVRIDAAGSISTFPSDGTGLVIDGDTVTYEGTFDTDDGEAAGSVAVTCP